MELKRFSADVFSDKMVKELCTTVVKPSYKKIFDNDILVDTAGFVPLDVRIKQFLLAGEQAKISSEMFDSDDWRYMFEHVNDNTLEVGDDIEDVNRKLAVVLDRQREILLRKSAVADEEAYTPDEASDKKRSENKASDGSVNASDSQK